MTANALLPREIFYGFPLAIFNLLSCQVGSQKLSVNCCDFVATLLTYRYGLCFVFTPPEFDVSRREEFF